MCSCKAFFCKTPASTPELTGFHAAASSEGPAEAAGDDGDHDDGDEGAQGDAQQQRQAAAGEDRGQGSGVLLSRAQRDAQQQRQTAAGGQGGKLTNIVKLI